MLVRPDGYRGHKNEQSSLLLDTINHISLFESLIQTPAAFVFQEYRAHTHLPKVTHLPYLTTGISVLRAPNLIFSSVALVAHDYALCVNGRWV